jgi:hypothetical protein
MMDTISQGDHAAAASAGWIAPRLAPFESATVGSVIPAGFAAYARILHPVSQDDTVVRWSQVAAWSGQPLTRLAQFHDVAMPEHTAPPDPPWDSQGPEEGTLTPDDAAQLVDVLADHTPTRRCWFGLWEGYGFDDAVYRALGDPDNPDNTPRLELPNRGYFLYRGDLATASTFVPDHRQTPNLWWAPDHSWCVASEIDLPCTYLGGPAELVGQVLGHPSLEALPAQLDDLVCVQPPRWLEDRVDAAAEELLEHGHTTLTTSVGAVHATLRTATPLRNGVLRIQLMRELPGRTRGGGSEIPLTIGAAGDLRATAAFHLLHGTLGMVNH